MAIKNLGKVVPEKGVDYFTDEDIQSLNIPKNTSDLINDSSYATESYVKNQIADAQLGGEGGNVDLSGYATKDELPTKTSQLTNDSGFITDYEESDPTVPVHVKAITEEDINKWNTGGDVYLSDYVKKEYIDNIISTLSLGVDAEDGNIYLYVNGVKQGMGLTINSAEINGVVGSIDENNNIEITGLPTGTYILKYANAYGALKDYDDLATLEVE